MKTIYWIEDKKEPSAEFEDTVTFSRKKVIKTLKKFKKEDVKHKHIFIVKKKKIGY